MKPTFIQKVDAFIRENQLLDQGMRVVVAVSGGADSLALLYYLKQRSEKDDLCLVAAHVDHMFRGEESYQDLIYVQNICEQLNIPFEGAQIPVSSYQEESGLGAQVAARECRYQFLERIVKKYRAHALALGHHGDDQIETILMRLVRGSSMKGYAGMRAKRKFGSSSMIRPFLAVTKEEIEEYCQEQDIVPRVDPSNSKDSYTRNRFRKYILPQLKQENQKVHEKFQTFSKFLQQDDDYLQELATERMNKVIRKEKDDFMILSIPDFESLPTPLQRRGIELILNYLYNHKLPSTLSSIHIEQAMAFLKRSHPSGALHFPNGLKVTRTYEECSFGFYEETISPFSYTLSVPGIVTLPNGDELTAEICQEIPSLHDALFIAPRGAISEPLIVRSRMDGDRMKVKGMNGTKKIKAIFIEQKVPKQRREEWPIVCDAQGTVLWLPLLKKSSASVSTEVSKEGSYILIRYKSKESSRRINR